jgi:Zn-dependent metalloprotease
MFNLISLSVLLLLFSNSFAQIALNTNDAKAHLESKTIELEFKDYSSLPYYAKFKSDVTLDQAKAMVLALMNVPADNGFALLNKEDDQIGFTHYRYEQTYKGVPVMGGMYLFHIKNGMVHSMNGNLYGDITTNAIAISEAAAFDNAKAVFGNAKFKWESADEEAHIKLETGNPNATNKPAMIQKLIPSKGAFLEKSKTYALCYTYNLYTIEPTMDRKEVFVNAATGEIEFSNQLLQEVSTSATAITGYSGTQTIVVDSTSPTLFTLKDLSRGQGVETYNELNTTNPIGKLMFTNNSSIWNNVNANYDQYATDAHWGAEMTYDYMFKRYNRNSIDNNGFKIKNYVHYNTKSFANANWDGSRMNFGDAGGKPFTTIDIEAHEIGHGWTTNTSNLVYQNESGALNEGFSDIMGVCVDYYARPNKANFLMGEETGSLIRDMTNPKAAQNPDTYFGQYWATGTADNGGVHTNSGLLNFWFYLMSKGGKGVNDLFNTYDVVPLGIDTAGAIAYRTNTNYLVSTSKYIDARNFSIKAAEDLYGKCSPAVKGTINAWYAVGFGEPYVDALDFNASAVSSCNIPYTVEFKTVGYNMGTKWIFNGDIANTSTGNVVTKTYTAPASIDVKLIRDMGCNKDSLSKTQLVNIANAPQPACSSVASFTPTSFILSATLDTTYKNGSVEWYDSDTSTVPMFSGLEYVTPVLSATQKYYAKAIYPKDPVKGGLKDNVAGGGAYHTTAALTNYLVFDVINPCTLNSVTVYSSTAKARTFELRSSTGALLRSENIVVSTGKQVVTLNFELMPNQNYRLGIASAEIPNFYKTISNVAYPYVTKGLVSVKSIGNTANAGYYPFFYDWNLQEGSCVSDKLEVVASVFGASINDISVDNVSLYPIPVEDVLNITNTNATSIDVVLYDINMREIMTLSNISKEGKIDMTQIQKGIYLVKMSNGKAERFTKVVKN